MISDPIVYVECDNEDCDYNEEYGMTPLARGAFDDRDVKSEAESNGWYFVNDDTCYCEYCKEDFE